MSQCELGWFTLSEFLAIESSIPEIEKLVNFLSQGKPPGKKRHL